MTYTSIVEKFLNLLNLVSTSWIYIAFIILNVIFLGLLLFKVISKKITFILSFITTNILLVITIISNYKAISSLTNTIIDNLFTNIYFPSAYFYLFILVLINISAIISFLSPRLNNLYKIINSVFLILINFILVLVLEVIATNNIDVFKKESIFANPNLLSLLELSINLFIVWLVLIIAIYLINTITERIIITKGNRELVKKPITPLETSVSLDTLNKEYPSDNRLTNAKEVVQAIMPNDYQYKFIPTFTVTEPVKVENKFIPEIKEEVKPTYSYNNSFDLSSFIPKKQEVKPINVEPNMVERIINNELPTPIKPEEEKKNTYTLNDYRLFNKMLKDIREHNQSNSVTIDKELEYRLITKYSTEAFNQFKTMLSVYSD